MVYTGFLSLLWEAVMRIESMVNFRLSGGLYLEYRRDQIWPMSDPHLYNEDTVELLLGSTQGHVFPEPPLYDCGCHMELHGPGKP